MPYIKPNDDATKHVTFMFGLEVAGLLVGHTLREGAIAVGCPRSANNKDYYNSCGIALVKENF